MLKKKNPCDCFFYNEENLLESESIFWPETDYVEKMSIITNTTTKEMNNLMAVTW